LAVAISILIGLGDRALADEASEAPPPAPEAPAPTRASIRSTGARQWDVLIDDQHVCSTPCGGPLFPQQSVVLHSQERNPVVLELGPLPPGDVLVSAKPHESGQYAGGIVATTLGGMALAIGITFLSVGLAKDRDGMTVAGAITGAAGLITLPFGIYLMVGALPTVSIDQAHDGRLH
jgi:hypothetical protein